MRKIGQITENQRLTFKKSALMVARTKLAWVEFDWFARRYFVVGVGGGFGGVWWLASGKKSGRAAT
jgi:hypothetical protein